MIIVTPDIFDKENHVLFLHGFNVTESEAKGVFSETFKRLYHSGSNRLFTGITWNGDEGVFAGLNYWGNVENPFNTADDLAGLVSGIYGIKTIIAHSLGNMVVSSAIQDFNMNVNHYLMIDPAVATEAYVGEELTVQFMRQPDWDAYTIGGDYAVDENRRLWSSQWYSLFDGNDARNKLTWRGRFE